MSSPATRYAGLSGSHRMLPYFQDTNDKKWLFQSSTHLVTSGLLAQTASVFAQLPTSTRETVAQEVVHLKLDDMLVFGWQQDRFRLLRDQQGQAPISGSMRHSGENAQLWLDQDGAAWIQQFGTFPLLSNDGSAVVNEAGAVLYVVRWDNQDTPVLLKGMQDSSVLVLGADYVRAGNALLFRLRPTQHQWCATLASAPTTPFSFAGIRVPPGLFADMASLYRGEVSTQTLSRVLCSMLGVDAWPRDGKVTSVQHLSDQLWRAGLDGEERIYRTTKAPALFADVRAGNPVDASFQFLPGAQRSALDWSAGANLDIFPHFPRIPAGVLRCESTSSPSPSVRIYAQQDEADSERFLEYQVRTGAGQDLWDFLGFTGGAQVKFVDVLDLMFQALGEWALILSSDAGRITPDHLQLLRKILPNRVALVHHTRP